MDMRYEGQHEITVAVDPGLSLDQIMENLEKNFAKKSMVDVIRGELLSS